MAKKKGKKGKTIRMPGLGDVESFSAVPEGDYSVAVSGVELKEGEKGEYVNWEFTIQEGSNKGQKLWTNTSFSPAALWNLKALLEAMDAPIPEEPEDMAINDFIGLELVVSVQHEERKGKTRATITDYGPIGGEDAEDVEVEDGGDDEDSDEKYTAEQIQDMDTDELKDVIKKHDLDVKLKDYKTAKKKANAVIEALEEEDLMEEEDDE